MKVLAGVDTSFSVTSKAGDDEDFSELYTFKWTTSRIPPTSLLLLDFIGVVAGISNAIYNGYESWGPLFGKLFCQICILGDCPFISLPQRFGRKTKQDTNNCHCLVRPTSFNLLTSVGLDRSFPCKERWPSSGGM
ncbi:hypothetical protein ABZP36_012830 [Zizania latifolia]